MSITNLLWLLALIVITAVLYIWLFRGRAFGYTALALRTAELNKNGVREVYLLYSTTDVGWGSGINLQFDPIWSFLNTGFLGYLDRGKLVIEFPWWNKMRLLATIAPNEASVLEDDFLYASRKKPGLRIGDRVYGFAGVNIDNKDIIKQSLKSLDSQTLNSNRQLFVTQITGAGFSVDSSRYAHQGDQE